MQRMVGTVVRGIRTPIINQGDNLKQLVPDCVLQAAQAEGFAIRDRDIIAITESVVGRAQGNYASVHAIAADVEAKFAGDTIGLVFHPEPQPIRNLPARHCHGGSKNCSHAELSR